MNKIFIIVILTVLVFAVPVGAKPEKIVMGPYNVSFDMENISTYSIKINPHAENKNLWGLPYTVYEATIDGSSEEIPHSAEISILDFEGFVSNNIEEAVKVTADSSWCKESDAVVARTIDSKEGALSPACDFSIFVFGYPIITIDGANLMLASVMASSTYPWDKGTSNLIDTIHVEVSSSKDKDIEAAKMNLSQEATKE